MGELQIKGAWTVSSYFKTNNQESFTKDGWFKTGDVSQLMKMDIWKLRIELKTL
jgi:fatty-acyl-CoA synthase